MPAEQIAKNYFVLPPFTFVGSRQRKRASDEKAKEMTKNAPSRIALCQEVTKSGRSANPTVPVIISNLDFNLGVIASEVFQIDTSIPESTNFAAPLG
jgi:hypothetical protein